MRYFTENDEWVDVDGTTGTIGITPEGAAKLGEITFVELPEMGSSVSQGGTLCTVESVKAAVDLFAPLSGTITEVNTALSAEPHHLGERANETWIARVEISNSGETAALMDADAYKSFAGGN